MNIEAKELFTSSYPSVLIPYKGPSFNPDDYDFFFYLRPESNGVTIESMALKMINSVPEYKENLKLIYMANIPGEFIVERHIVERHYRTKLIFATHGKKYFTPHMKIMFKKHFGINADEANVIGAFEALRYFKMEPEELFNIWVPMEDVLSVHGQTIKKYMDTYIVNYDIPALMHKNNRNTDIAVLMFRTTLDPERLFKLAEDMKEKMHQAGFLRKGMALSRLIHITKGPLEQILDAAGYLYKEKDLQFDLEDISFARFLLEAGMSREEIMGMVTQPIVTYQDPGDKKHTIKEGNLYNLCEKLSYKEAREFILHVKSHFILK
ncbi:hypothetical protein WKV44_00955 [Spirochaetia bacterium 38H-sp]|uniref:Uncharacterized protein n=1 Tax=Rarispira pelagica TaxID=3141764 RepID=A0ABU9U8W8_9SPIR